MDWQNKFYSIVKETEDNLAKAKEKLSGKAYPHTTNSQVLTTLSKTGTCLPGTAIITTLNKDLSGYSSSSARPEIPTADMNSGSSFQVLHMQEQIDSQNRTIEKLQKLVRSLDNERDFYKEQINQLKGDVDNLTDKMSGRFVASSPDRQMSNVKREVMHEISKVKAMLTKYTEDVNRKQTSLSPRFDDEFWAVKENLTENLEQLRLEINLMNRRIDRMESKLALEPFRPEMGHVTRNYQNGAQYPRSPRLYTPIHNIANGDPNAYDVMQLKSTINSLNSKLDNLEKKIKSPRTQWSSLSTPLPTSRPLRSFIATNTTIPEHRTFLAGNDRGEDLDDLNSLSDLSDLSETSENNIDEEIDLLTYELRDGAKPKSNMSERKSIYKRNSKTKGKVEFDLSDLDLSDVDDVDIDTDSLDLEA